MGSIAKVTNLVLYDGVCKFCNSSVNFILDHERNQALSFAPIQSDLGRSILRKFDLPLDYTDSLLYYEEGKLFSHSKAAFKISEFLKKPWSWVSIMQFLPAVFTDFFYNLIARHRYKLMGKTDTCSVPNPKNAQRFLE